MIQIFCRLLVQFQSFEKVLWFYSSLFHRFCDLKISHFKWLSTISSIYFQILKTFHFIWNFLNNFEKFCLYPGLHFILSISVALLWESNRNFTCSFFQLFYIADLLYPNPLYVPSPQIITETRTFVESAQHWLIKSFSMSSVLVIPCFFSLRFYCAAPSWKYDMKHMKVQKSVYESQKK